MKWTLLSLFVLTASCTSLDYDDVRPGVDGIHRVSVLGNGEGDGERNAIEQANNYCRIEKKMSPVFMTENTDYQGTMDEETHKTVRKASKAAGAVGVGMGVFGGRRESGAGRAVMGAGSVGAIMTRNDYKTEMKFQCK